MKLKLSSLVPWQKIFLRKKTHRKGMLFSDNTCILFGCPLLVCIESWWKPLKNIWIFTQNISRWVGVLFIFRIYNCFLYKWHTTQVLDVQVPVAKIDTACKLNISIFTKKITKILVLTWESSRLNDFILTLHMLS
jgi:hypothetical protein